MTAAAKIDPFKALAILRAIQERVPGVSDHSLHIIWRLRQPGICDEFRALSELDDNGELPYGSFRGADSLEASASVFLSDGFLNFEDYSDGGIYVSAFAAECGVHVDVVEVALDAFEADSKATQCTATQATDAIFIKAVRKGVEAARRMGRKRVAIFPYAGIVDGDGRVHKDRYEEKVLSEQLFGRFGRQLVRAAGGDDESMSEKDLIAAVEKKMVVHNRVFMSRRLLTALAMEGGAVYRRAGKGITAVEQDVEGIATALIGGMIETGGLNVAYTGSQAKRFPGRSEVLNDAHFAVRFMRDVAFADAAGGDAAAFEKAYKLVKKLLAKELFSREERMMQRLAATSVLLKEEGLATLAKADAKAFRKRPCPTYDTIDAGTFSRALAAENGRKGGSATAKLIRDYFDPEVEQSPEDKLKAERIIFSGTPPGPMTGEAKRVHVAKCEAGGGCPPGAMTGEAKRVHVDQCEAGGGSPPGAMTGEAKRVFVDQCEEGGGSVAGVAKTDQQRLKAVIGKYAKSKKDGFPIAVSRVIMHTASENTYTFYVSRDASLEEYNAFFFKPFGDGCHAEELYHIMCPSGAKSPEFILPLSNDSRCEGAAIGGAKVKTTGNWRGWSREAYSQLKKTGVTWSVSDVPITDAMLGAHALEKAATKAARKSRARQAAKERKKRKREAPSAPGPGLVKKRRTT